MESAELSKLKSALLPVFSLYRSTLLDVLELQLGDTPYWNAVRSRVMKAFGQGGLPDKIFEATLPLIGSIARKEG